MDERPDNVGHHLLILDVVEPLVEPKQNAPRAFATTSFCLVSCQLWRVAPAVPALLDTYARFMNRAFPVFPAAPGLHGSIYAHSC